MSLCATEQSKGFYFGMFWSIFMSSQIVGNLIGSIIIKKTSGPSFFLIMGCVLLSSLLGYCFLIIPKNKIDDD